MNYKTTILSKVSNTIFYASIVFCIFFLWCNFYTKNVNISFISSIIVFTAFLIIYIPIKLHKTNKSKISQSKKDKFDYFKLQIKYSQNSTILEVLKKYLNITSYKQISPSHYLINNQFDFFIIKNKDITNSEIENIFSNRQSSDIQILSLEIFNIPINLKNVKIAFIELEDLHNFYIQNNLHHLENIELQKKPKYSIKDILRIVLCKQKSKNYFFIGVLLLFSSLITPYSTYYIIFSSLLFIMAFVSRFDFNFNSKKSETKKT